MSQLILELNDTETTELDTLAAVLRQPPTALAKTALMEFITNQPAGANQACSAVREDALQKTDSAAEARARAKQALPGFGMLKDNLMLDGVPVADGVEYQNRIRSDW